MRCQAFDSCHSLFRAGASSRRPLLGYLCANAALANGAWSWARNVRVGACLHWHAWVCILVCCICICMSLFCVCVR